MSVLAEIKNSLGAFVVLNKQLLMEQMMQRTVSMLSCRTIMEEAQDGNVIGIKNTHLDEVVQSFQPVTSYKGNFRSGAETTVQRRHKIDMLVEPDKIVGEWEGYLYDEKLKRKDMPLVKYIMQKLMAKIEEDREEKMIYKGVYVPIATPGVATPAQDTVDGYGKIIADAATAGKFTPFVMGAYTASDIFEYIEEFLVNIPSTHRYKKLYMHLSPDELLAYQRDKRNTFQYQTDLAKTLKIDFSQIEFRPWPSMAGSKRIFCTVPGNLVRIIHKNQTADNIDIDEQKYSINPFGDWHECYGVADFRYFWSNDQV